MAGTLQQRRNVTPELVFSSALLVAAMLASPAVRAQAQICGGKLPAPDAVSAVGSDKFRLALGQCPALSEPARPHRASQLDLYDRGSVTITMSDDDPAPAPAPRAPSIQPLPPAPAPQPGTQLTSPGARRDVARIAALAPAVTAAAQAHGVDPLLLHAVAHVESRHNANAVSPAGARGLMQVMPATGKRFGVADESRLFDPQTNLHASAAYLRNLGTRYDNNLPLVLAAYNAGEGAVDKYGRNVPPYAETQAYVRDVLAIYRRLTTSTKSSGGQAHAGVSK
jgi:soluble lytic murein transglycosylase-like protein